MTFHYKNQFTVEFASTVFRYFESFIAEGNFHLETGGIMAGTLHPIKSEIMVTDVTTPQRLDRRMPYRFLRNSSGHQDIMDELWKQSNFEKLYLGEWHSHKEPYPRPSSIDIRHWLKIANKKQNSLWMLFVIVGTMEFRIWTVEYGKIYPLSKEIGDNVKLITDNK